MGLNGIGEFPLTFCYLLQLDREIRTINGLVKANTDRIVNFDDVLSGGLCDDLNIKNLAAVRVKCLLKRLFASV
jgi:hypothetical protein